jgi:hypothetical protein
MTDGQKRENVRACMILNEVLVIAASKLNKETFDGMQDRLIEVRDIILNQTFYHEDYQNEIVQDRYAEGSC